MYRLLTLALLVLPTPALAYKEIEVQQRYCDGLPMNQQLRDGSEVDCLINDFAVEVDFSSSWAQAIGQSLHYARITEARPAIILVCNEGTRQVTCDKHLARLQETLVYWRIGMLVWYCNPQLHAELTDCQFIDLFADTTFEE